MRVSKEINIEEFEFWSGAERIADQIRNSEREKELWNIFEDLCTCGGCDEDIDECKVNDIMWFDFADWLTDNGWVDYEEEDGTNTYITEEDLADICEDVMQDHITDLYNAEKEEIADYVRDNNLLDSGDVTDGYNAASYKDVVDYVNKVIQDLIVEYHDLYDEDEDEEDEDDGE